MYGKDSKGISYTAGFFLLIAFAIAGLMMAQLMTITVWQSMTGQPVEAIKTGITNPAYGPVFRIIQVLNEVLGYFLPAIAVAFLLNRKPMRLLGFTGKITIRQVALVIVLTGLAMLIGAAFSYINHKLPLPGDWKTVFDKMEADYIQQAKAILNLQSAADYIIALLVMAVVPAVCEETLFRGGLQNFMSRSTKNPWLALIVVSLIFSAAHFSFYGFLFRFFLGMVLGLVYMYSGSLWLAILAHFINNGLAVTIYYSYLRSGKPVEEAMNMTADTWWTIALLPVLMLLFTLLRRVAVKENEYQE